MPDIVASAVSTKQLREKLCTQEFQCATLNKSQILTELMPVIVEKYKSHARVADLTDWICKNAFPVTQRTLYRRIRLYLGKKSKPQNPFQATPRSAFITPVSRDDL